MQEKTEQRLISGKHGLPRHNQIFMATTFHYVESQFQFYLEMNLEKKKAEVS